MFTNNDVKFLLILKFANHQTKEPFVWPANKALVGTLITIGDVMDIFAIAPPEIGPKKFRTFEKLARRFLQRGKPSLLLSQFTGRRFKILDIFNGQNNE